MKIHNEVMNDMSNDEVVLLVLLDLSAAFDSKDHNVLIKRLKNVYPVSSQFNAVI